MSKYNKGDKFEIEIKEVVVSECGKALYAVEDVPILILDDYIFDRLRQIKPVEPEVDWSKVPVDTPMLVRSYTDSRWRRRYFAKYEDGKVYTWTDGATSWSDELGAVSWGYAKLAEVE